MGVGEQIKDWRKRAGLRQQDLAELVGVTQAAISRWEGGAEVQAAHWPALAAALQLSDMETARLCQALIDQYAPASEAA